jgi:hypothetical protein
MSADDLRGPAAEDPRPWERPGAVRRDVAPHRGDLLAMLGGTSLTLGILSMVLCIPFLVGLPLSLVTVVLAGRDLESMALGVMDPEGRAQTEQARRRGEYGVVLSAFGPFTTPFLLGALASALGMLVALLQGL